ncbi:MAG TPA: sigma-70 family RNA polymerase sigma factor [Planctomycetota bacterium]|nr:sigma-70 family RNA polymerase sigma factor [Planctomycetota bacterium]
MNVAEFLILMVEDEPDQVLFTQRALEKANLVNPLRIVSNGQKAIAYLSGKDEYADRQANPLPSLILLDLKLPRIGGLDVLAWIRAQPKLKNIPVVVLTSSINPKDRERADQLGVSSYLCKPVDSEGLLEMMKSIGMYWMILRKNPDPAPAAPAASPELAALHVLVIDHDRDFLTALAEGLRRRTPSVQADGAANGEDALSLLASNPYDAVLVDREAAGDDVAGFLARITAARAGVPIFLLLPETDHAFEQPAKAGGAARVFVKQARLKPFLDEVHEAIATLQAPPVPEPLAEPVTEAPASTSARRSGKRCDTEILGDQVRFQKTSWELVRSAKDPQGMDQLIRVYWKPLYYFIRQKGFDNETAKDMVQGFLMDALERGTMFKADPSRGKFRTFLLAALSNFIKDWHKAASRLKRGGGQATLSLDFEGGERQYAIDVASGETPEAALNRAWAQSTLESCISELRGNPLHLQAFRLMMEGASYSEIGKKTGLGESAAKAAVFRLRQQLKDGVLRRVARPGQEREDPERVMADFAALLR